MNKVITKIRSGIGGYLKDNILFLTFVFASVLNGFLLRAFTVKFNYSQIKPLMADMAVILLLALISYVFKKPRKQFVYLLILTIIFSILCTANSIYYTNYKSFISVSLISTASQLGGVMDAVTENIMSMRKKTPASAAAPSSTSPTRPRKATSVMPMSCSSRKLSISGTAMRKMVPLE